MTAFSVCVRELRQHRTLGGQGLEASVQVGRTARPGQLHCRKLDEVGVIQVCHGRFGSLQFSPCGKVLSDKPFDNLSLLGFRLLIGFFGTSWGYVLTCGVACGFLGSFCCSDFPSNLGICHPTLVLED